MVKEIEDKDGPGGDHEGTEQFVNDECGDYMWDEALQNFEKSEQDKDKENGHPKKNPIGETAQRIDHELRKK